MEAILADWQALESTIAACRRCPRLVTWREEVACTRRRAYRDEAYWGKPVPGFGDREARVLVVGLAPAAHGANRTGRMFTGDSSGDFLYAALYRAGFASRSASLHRNDGMVLCDVFITAACRCAPPFNKPTSEELVACLPYLTHEIALLKRLQVIVALGGIAFDTVLRLYRGHSLTFSDPTLPVGSEKPRFSHGATYRHGEGLPWLAASYHPSRQNTQTRRLTVEMFDGVWVQVRHLLGELYPL